MCEGVESSILRLEGRTTCGPRSISESCPFPKSGTMKDFGVVGSDEIIRVMDLGEGSRSRTRGCVIRPNTIVLKRTTVIVLVIMIAFPLNVVCPNLVN